jgi:hypothetical protein
MERQSRRDFLKTGALVAGSVWGASREHNTTLAAGNTESQGSVEVLNPRGRVPLSFVIDDSTCLVNMGHFCMPQFAQAWPDREIYKKPWKTWPREIPDAFVREFGGWCAEHGVKGKYSIVPYPACVGWLDRELPGWSRRELLDSLTLVRELMVPNWDIHPEMITHTRVIDLNTGRPFDEISPATMENSYPVTKKSVDELAAYLAYALRILKNCDLPCAGITTPGGFGGRVQAELPLAVFQAVQEVYGASLSHYFKYVSSAAESTRPRVEHVEGLDTSNPRAVVHVPAATGDWFGGWDGDRTPEADRYANHDATGGRLVELIEQGEPAIMLCHWPGMYTQGTRQGFLAFQRVVRALEQRFGRQTLWMKLSEMARYGAARELTRMERTGHRITLNAPFAAPDFTLRIPTIRPAVPRQVVPHPTTQFREVSTMADLTSGTWLQEPQGLVLCLDLPQGKLAIDLHPSTG